MSRLLDEEAIKDPSDYKQITLEKILKRLQANFFEFRIQNVDTFL